MHPLRNIRMLALGLALSMTFSNASLSHAVLPSIIETPPELLTENNHASPPESGTSAGLPTTRLQIDTLETTPSFETAPPELTPSGNEKSLPETFQSTLPSINTPIVSTSVKTETTVETSELPILPTTESQSPPSETSQSEETTSHLPSDKLIEDLSDDLEASKKPSAEDFLASLSPELRQEVEKLTQGLHREHQAIFNELRDDEELALNDITMLWQAAIERSGSIRFAIEKLSRRSATGQPVDQVSFTKRLFQNLTQLTGTAASIWTGTPAGVLGGGLVQDLMDGDPSVSAMSRVTDADMLILAKEVERLQTSVIEAYYSYRHKEAQWKLARESKHNLGKYYAEQYALSTPEVISTDPAGSPEEIATASNTPNINDALQPVLDALYNSILLQEENAHRHYISARDHLGLLVGGDALVALEKTRSQSARK